MSKIFTVADVYAQPCRRSPMKMSARCGGCSRCRFIHRKHKTLTITADVSAGPFHFDLARRVHAPLVEVCGLMTIGLRWQILTPYILSILRIITAFLFMQFGTAKLFAFPAPVMPDGGTVSPGSLIGVAALLEAVGGLLMLIGLFSRPVAFILAGEMAVAYFMSHAPQGFWPVLNQGTPAVLFSFLWLYISAAGPGPWSLDAVLRQPAIPRRRREDLLIGTPAYSATHKPV